MKVELRNGELRGTFDCGNDVFFVGCRLTQSKRQKWQNTINTNIFDDIHELQRIFGDIDIRTSELSLGSGMSLQLWCFTTDDPSILDIMKPYAGMKMIEVVDEEFELTITV